MFVAAKPGRAPKTDKTDKTDTNFFIMNTSPVIKLKSSVLINARSVNLHQSRLEINRISCKGPSAFKTISGKRIKAREHFDGTAVPRLVGKPKITL
jgi:hypothetical protein